MYQNKRKVKNGILIHYLDNCVASDKLVVIFPPGIEDARFVMKIDIETQLKNHRIISITYPSRYKSTHISGEDTIDRMNCNIVEVLEEIMLEVQPKKVVLVGFSFGTMIVTRLLQKYAVRLSKRAEDIKVILVNPGEFFPPRIKKLLLFLFKPAYKSEAYRKILKFALVNVAHVFSEDSFPVHRLGDINEQWNATLKYKVVVGTKAETPSLQNDGLADKSGVSVKNTDILNKTKTFIGKNDRIIDKNSIEKIKNVYKNISLEYYDGGHIVSYGKSKDFTKIKGRILDSVLEN